MIIETLYYGNFPNKDGLSLPRKSAWKNIDFKLKCQNINDSSKEDNFALWLVEIDFSQM